MAEGLIQFPAPVLGMHGGISDVNMPDGYCRLLYNMVPDGIGLYTRRPWLNVKETGVTAPNWLYAYTINTANGLFYLTNNNDSIRVLANGSSSSANMLSSSGTVSESVGFHFNSLFIYTHYPAGGPRQYDGTTESALSITRPGSGDWNSLTDADVTGGHPFKSRVYYWSFKTNEIMYTAVNAPGGTLVRFPLENVSTTGGNVKLITSLSMDGGNGPDDLLVICLDTGETLIYQGSDPGNSADWSIIGRFHMPPPLNADSVCIMGGDALILTAEGLVPVQQYVKATFGRVEVDWIRAINPTIAACIGRLGSTIRGRPYYSDHARLLLVNVRASSAYNNAVSFAMNIDTGGWFVMQFGLNDGIQSLEDYENAIQIPYGTDPTTVVRSGLFFSFCDSPGATATLHSILVTNNTVSDNAFIAAYGNIAASLTGASNDLNGEPEAGAISQEVLHTWRMAGPAFVSREARVSLRVFDNEADLAMASPTLTVYRDFRPDQTAVATLNTAAPYTVTKGLGIEGHALSARVTFTSKGGARFSPSGFLYQGTILSAEDGKL